MSESIDGLKRRLKKIGDEADKAYITYKEKTHAANWLQAQINNLEANIAAQKLKSFVGKYWRFSNSFDEQREDLILFIRKIGADTEEMFVRGIGVYARHDKCGKITTAALKRNAYFSVVDHSLRICLEWGTLNLKDACPSTREEFLDMVTNNAQRLLSEHEDGLTED